MEERERMLDTIMEMQRWNGLKDKQIEELEQENQALNDRWQKLKEFIEKDHDWNLERGDNDCALGQRWVLEKMQELEKE